MTSQPTEDDTDNTESLTATTTTTTDKSEQQLTTNSDSHGASDEATVTLDEVIEAHEELEAEAEALLGGASADVCTYPEGYKPRQPLYSCRSCLTGRAVLCYGCSVTCHDGHELIELYTKRNFSCDCGNSKFDSECLLYKEKKPLNERNVYNHNFDGLYCICNKEYPCEEYKDSEMLQCVVCEDWFHLQHLTDPVEAVDLNEVEEVICHDCISHNDYLEYYADKTYSEECKSTTCTLNSLMSIAKIDEDRKYRSLFFNSHLWRNRLCQCDSCLGRYEDGGIYFLTDLSDSVHSYIDAHANHDEPKCPEDINSEMTNALINVAGREGAITVFQGYEEMKQKLGSRLKRLAEENKEVKKEDIYEFFQELETERKRRREDQREF